MLTITIPNQELFCEKTETFKNIKETKIKLEHSLISLSKWESKWHKPFIGRKDKEAEEIIDYIRCMSLTKVEDPDIYKYIPSDIYDLIMDYIDNPMTATWFSKEQEIKSGIQRGEVITSEIIYYWMVTLGIPFECEKWHLNRLITLIRVINIKNGPKKKMDKNSLLRNNAKLNAARRAKHRSRG